MVSELSELVSGPLSSDLQAQKTWTFRSAQFFKNHPSKIFQTIAVPLEKVVEILESQGAQLELTSAARERIDFHIFCARALTLPAWAEQITQITLQLEPIIQSLVDQGQQTQLKSLRNVLTNLQPRLLETYQALREGHVKDLRQLQHLFIDLQSSFERLKGWINA